MSRSTRLISTTAAALFVVLVATLFAGSASAAPPPRTPDQANHERTVRYWTPDRVARATPREILFDGPTRLPFAKPGGGGGGGGGGGTSAVTGATWTGGGDVRANTGKVLFTMAGGNWVCSGSVVQDARTDVSLVLTAGHCVVDEATGIFATNWMFIPDYQSGGTFSTCGATTYGCWTAKTLVTNDAWRSTGDFEEDYGFAVVGTGGKDALNPSTQLDVAVGGAYQFDFTGTPAAASAFGYPAAGKYNGRTLTYCAGSVIADPYGAATYGVKCNMTGGSSGGPWLAPFSNNEATDRLTSLNSYGYTAGPYKGYMFGPHFDADTQATFEAANNSAPDATTITVAIPGL